MPLSNLSVLIVDDNAYMRKLVAAILRGLGARAPLEAPDGPTAFGMMRDTYVDIVIVDQLMETLQGVEFVRLLRTAHDSPNPYAAVVMLTAKADRTTVLAAKDAGVSAFVAKPVSARSLMEGLRRAIENPTPAIAVHGNRVATVEI